MSKFTREMWLLAAKRGDTDESFDQWVRDMKESTRKGVVRPRIFPRDMATILCALRFWQQSCANGESVSEAFVNIATDEDSFDRLSLSEIDQLCEELNTIEPDETVAYLYKNTEGKVVTVGTRTPTARCKLEIIELVAK